MHKDFETEYEKIQEKIKRLGYVFLRKMRQPSPHDIDDMVQDAIETVNAHLVSERPDAKKGASVSTYLMRGVRNHFVNMVKASYKQDFDFTMENRRRFDRLKRDLTHVTQYPESVGLNLILDLQDTLNYREKEYLAMIINPTDEVIRMSQSNKKKLRPSVRTVMNMERQEERLIRDKLKVVLTA